MSTTAEKTPPAATANPPRPSPFEDRVVLHGIDWETYRRLCDAKGDQRVFVAYDRGVLELMSPGSYHEGFKKLLARFVETVTFALGMPCRGMGSTRWESAEAERGIEPDESYYLTPEKIAASRRRSDGAFDGPPPDLAIEVDLRRGEVDRSRLYGSLGVVEVWRSDGEMLRIDRLREDGTYQGVTESGFLPVGPADVRHWLLEVDSDDQTAWTGRLLEWVRRELPARRAPGGPEA